MELVITAIIAVLITSVIVASLVWKIAIANRVKNYEAKVGTAEEKAREIIDEAIAHSRKLNVKNIAKKIFGKAKDEADRILLTEEDFKL